MCYVTIQLISEESWLKIQILWGGYEFRANLYCGVATAQNTVGWLRLGGSLEVQVSFAGVLCHYTANFRGKLAQNTVG